MERELALEQLAIRLSHMSDGIDEGSDRLLEQIRAAVKGDASGKKIESLSAELARALITSTGIDIDKGPVVQGGYDLSGLRKLIKSMPVDPDAQERMNELVRQAAAGQTQTARQKALVDLLGIAAEAIQSVAHKDKADGGVLGWLGKKSNGDQDERYVGLFASLLQRLVEHIDVLNGNALRSHEIREALQQVLHPSQAQELLDEVTQEIERIDARIRAERSQTTDFLGDLRARLGDFEDVIQLLAKDTDSSLERSEDLKVRVDEDARSIGEAAGKDSIEEVRSLLREGVTRITQRLADHVVAERAQHEASQAKVAELNERLARLESEADVLRSELRNKNDLALKDALTGAYNRAGYEERTQELYARWQRSGAALSLVFVDCNKFKQINDTYGHAAGDLVLVKVSDVLSERSRASDIVCRYGGDEFVVLLPDTHAHGAEVFARSACKEILAAGFNDNGKPIDVSISCGVTELIEGDTLETAVARADEAMYEAKKMSGICVAVKT
jgi:diguanylate cyclase